MKVTCLQSNREAGAVVDRLMEEIKSYKTLLKCSVCHERQKEVNQAVTLFLYIYLFLFISNLFSLS